MLQESIAGRVLAGVRGRPTSDIQAAAEAIAAFSRFGAADLGRYATAEINPLIVRANGAIGVDVLIEPHSTIAETKI